MLLSSSSVFRVLSVTCHSVSDFIYVVVYILLAFSSHNFYFRREIWLAWLMSKLNLETYLTTKVSLRLSETVVSAKQDRNIGAQAVRILT
jgi:hypothetical protein